MNNPSTTDYPKLRIFSRCGRVAAMVLDIFCEVIDNYGDIAIVYRLARTLKEARPAWDLRLIVDDLTTFSHLCPQVDCEKPDQTLDFARVLRWKDYEQGTIWKDTPPDFIIPFLGCELPENYYKWLGNQAPPSLQVKDRIILLVEYLTAEPWSEEIHKLPSLIPYPGLKKFFFVPGFRQGAGGILLDQKFLALRSLADKDLTSFRRGFAQAINQDLGSKISDLWLSLFSYEHDFTNLLEDLEGAGKPVLAFLPQGRPFNGLINLMTQRNYHRNDQGLWKNQNVSVLELPFLPQELYDHLVLSCDFNLVRGEESWMRAVVSGRPFLWQAYLQDEGYQIVKVEAFLEVLEPWILRVCGPEITSQVSTCFKAMNTREKNASDENLGERYTVFLANGPQLRQVFGDFASYLEKNADLTSKILDFLESFQL